VLLGLAAAALGLQAVLQFRFLSGLVPLPSWMSARAALLVLGLGLVTLGAALILARETRKAAGLLGLLWLLVVVLLHAPRLVLHPRAAGTWTNGFEVLALCGGAWVLFGLLPVKRDFVQGWQEPSGRSLTVGRWAFALSLPVFGVQHFMYVGYVASVIPGWIPGHTFWAYATGLCHIAAGLALASRVQGRLAALLAALMFGLWVLILHIPRALATRAAGAEWTATFVAIGMCGSALLIAAALDPEREATAD